MPVLPRQRNITAVVTVLYCGLAVSGCGRFAEWIAVRLFYRDAALAQARVYRDLNYWPGPSADPRKHQLDFYVPDGSGWPVLIFLHGGGWRSGDKALEFGGVDPYGNIGRFYSARGIGVAVANYRLQPAVSWRDQIRDVAQALAWVYGHADQYGANKKAIFISGHSAGAQLATRAAVDQKILRELGLPPYVPCGVIAVSGAPFDITDRRTTRLAFYEKTFGAGADGEGWKYEASAVKFVTSATPPFLLLHGRWEPPGLKLQNQVMYEALGAAGVPAELVVTPWDNHPLTVAAISYPGKIASNAILDFIRRTPCP